MSVFIKLPGKTVNLHKVNSIRFKEQKNKCYFNMNYSIQIERSGTTIWVSDYVDADIAENTELRSSLALNEYIAENFIEVQEKEDSTDKTFINIQNISSVKGEPEKLKVCINFGNPVTFRDGLYNKITSEFIYLNCSTVAEYRAKLSDLMSRL